jgi:hypothetical protein
MSPKVYISVGNAANPVQRDATDTIFRSLEAAGLSPRQMEKNEWSAEQPLRAIKRVIRECSGTVVIAFPRYRFPAGVERERSGGEKQLSDVRLPTVWNQIEAAMAYTMDLPLLVVAEHGLLDDGLLEGRYDWKVFWTDFTPEHLRSEAFIGYLASWRKLVLERETRGAPSAAGGGTDLTKMSLVQLCGQLTVPQLWATLSAIAAALAAVASIAFHAGAGHWPWQ